MKSDIMSISRLRMATDGEGITTLIGFYGCPLNCKYCINNQCHGDCVRIPYIPNFNTRDETMEEFTYLTENISAAVDVEIFDYIRC